MKKKKKCSYTVVGIDPGNQGGIAILSQDNVAVHPMPVKKEKRSGKIRTDYDLEAIMQILKPLQGAPVHCFLENVHVKPGEGSVSSFNFGKGFGQLQGISTGLGFTVELVTPTVWKKDFSDLQSDEFLKLKESQKQLSEDAKNCKDKQVKKDNKKQAEKLGRQMKAEAKSQARSLAARLYPALAEEFKLVKDDGKAESLLIAVYGRNKLEAQG